MSSGRVRNEEDEHALGFRMLTSNIKPSIKCSPVGGACGYKAELLFSRYTYRDMVASIQRQVAAVYSTEPLSSRIYNSWTESE